MLNVRVVRDGMRASKHLATPAPAVCGHVVWTRPCTHKRVGMTRRGYVRFAPLATKLGAAAQYVAKGPIADSECPKPLALVPKERSLTCSSATARPTSAI